MNDNTFDLNSQLNEYESDWLPERNVLKGICCECRQKLPGYCPKHVGICLKCESELFHDDTDGYLYMINEQHKKWKEEWEKREKND